MPWPATKSGRLLLVLLTAVLALSPGGHAAAYWGASTTAGGSGASAAASMNTPGAPTGTVGADRAVSVTWSASTLSNAVAVAGYQVRRYDANTAVLQTILAGCTGTVAGTSCVEASVPVGQWRYTVTPLIGSFWAGAESATSSTVTVSESTVLTLSQTVFAGPFPTVISGSLTGFGASEGLTYRLDAGTSLTGSPSAAEADGSAAITTLSIPSAAEGAHTVYAIGANGAVASTTITIDTIAPTTGTISYATGYTNTGTVAVTFAPGTDGGSGLNTGSATLQRAVATLAADGTCGSYSAFSTIAVGPTSPYTDSTLSNMRCYQYQYVVPDNAGNNSAAATSASVAKASYTAAVSATSGLAGYWRLGDAIVGDFDTFDTAPIGGGLTGHTSDTGGTWTRQTGSGLDNAEVTNEHRLRADVSKITSYLYSGVPTSADYSVQADITVKSIVNEDEIYIIGRQQAGSKAGYAASYTISAAGVGAWTLWRLATDGTGTSLGAVSSPSIVAGTTYLLRLEMIGSAIKLYVNEGTALISVTDSTHSLVGKTALKLDAATIPTDTTGVHLDNFAFQAPVNLGYRSSPTLGVTGALVNDTDKAVTFNGTSYAVAPDAGSLDLGNTFSIEAWVKRADNATGVQTIVSKGVGAYKLAFNNNRITLYKDGTAAIVESTTTQLDMTQFHHYVATKDGAAVTLYVDGVNVTGTVTDQTTGNTATLLYIGSRNGTTEKLTGTVDEVAVYNSALSGSTVTAHYGLGSQ